MSVLRLIAKHDPEAIDAFRPRLLEIHSTSGDASIGFMITQLLEHLNQKLGARAEAPDAADVPEEQLAGALAEAAIDGGNSTEA